MTLVHQPAVSWSVLINWPLSETAMLSETSFKELLEHQKAFKMWAKSLLLQRTGLLPHITLCPPLSHQSTELQGLHYLLLIQSSSLWEHSSAAGMHTANAFLSTANTPAYLRHLLWLFSLASSSLHWRQLSTIYRYLVPSGVEASGLPLKCQIKILTKERCRTFGGHFVWLGWFGFCWGGRGAFLFKKK